MSAFDGMLDVATTVQKSLFGDPVTVDGVAGVAIVTPDSNMELGGGIQLYNGAHLVVDASDYPNIAVNSVVVWRTSTYVVTELDDVNLAGLRNGRLVKQ